MDFGSYLRNDFLDINILTDNGRIITPKLERNALQRLRTRLHHFLACGAGTREADLVNIGMCREHGTQVITTAEDLEHSGWEVLRPKLDELHIAVWCIWRRLDDHCVSGVQTRTNLAERKEDGIIPGHNCTAYA